MVKLARSFACQDCGMTFSKWTGRCSGCGSWNSIVEETTEVRPKGAKSHTGSRLDFQDLDGVSKSVERKKTHISEFDRVCGGGLVPGGALLIGGDPGIGKSTLLLQVSAQLAKNNRVIYITGEEGIDQIRLRGKRLDLVQAPIRLATCTNVNDILKTLNQEKDLDVVIIDSIQTMYLDNLDSAPGSVSQVRACTLELIQCAKKNNIILFLVGHVTKEGAIAGPRVLEHMVDTVLYFEGDRSHVFRILRTVKNRFGPTDEIGVFEMGEKGLDPVDNPSALFLSDRKQSIAGSSVFAGMEGTRPVLVEIQALVQPTFLATPRRAVIGWDQNRLAMILAVLESKCGIKFSGQEVYLNVTGGFRVQEPAADLAVAAALLSAHLRRPLPHKAIFLGEIGLTGEIRPVSHGNQRLKEAHKLGFIHAWVPKSKVQYTGGHFSINTLNFIYELVEHIQQL